MDQIPDKARSKFMWVNLLKKCEKATFIPAYLDTNIWKLFSKLSWSITTNNVHSNQRLWSHFICKAKEKMIIKQ